MRRLHIAGSIGRAVSSDTADWAHAVVRQITTNHVSRAGSMVCQISPERAPRRGFDWTVLEACVEALRAGSAQPRLAGRTLVHAVGAEADRALFSESEADTLDALSSLGAIELEFMPNVWRSWALLRQAEERVGELLIVLGGGVGAEQLAEMYIRSGKPVLPIDKRLGEPRGGRTAGGEWLAAQARVRPHDFIRTILNGTSSAALDRIRSHSKALDAIELGRRVSDLIERLPLPRAFFVRLLDRKAEAFQDVEWFFRNVVDHVVRERGFERLEVGTDPQRASWMNQEIFDNLHHAAVSVVDMTDRRLNCAIELGYALARGQPVILSTRSDAGPPPFDVDKLPFFFWDPSLDVRGLQEDYGQWWDRHASRQAVVSPATWLGLG